MINRQKGLHIDIRNNKLQDEDLIIVECEFVFLFVSLEIICANFGLH